MKKDAPEIDHSKQRRFPITAINAITAISIASLSLSGDTPSNNDMTKSSLKTSITEHQKSPIVYEDIMLENKGIMAFNPSRPIQTSTLIRAYQAYGGAIPPEKVRILGINRYLVDELIRRTRERFGLTSNEFNTSSIKNLAEFENVVKPFSTEQLDFLNNILNALPKYYLELLQSDNQITSNGSEKGGYLEIYSIDSDDEFGGYCFCDPEQALSGPAIVIHDVDEQFPERKRELARAFVHELTHALLNQAATDNNYQLEKDMYTIGAIRAIGIKTEITNHIPELIEILVNNNGLLELHGPNVSPRFQPNSLISYGLFNASEILPTAVMHFIEGKNLFIANYSPILGEKRAHKLYDFVADTLFGGKEYEENEFFESLN